MLLDNPNKCRSSGRRSLVAMAARPRLIWLFYFPGTTELSPRAAEKDRRCCSTDTNARQGLLGNEESAMGRRDAESSHSGER